MRPNNWRPILKSMILETGLFYIIGGGSFFCSMIANGISHYLMGWSISTLHLRSVLVKKNAIIGKNSTTKKYIKKYRKIKNCKKKNLQKKTISVELTRCFVADMKSSLSSKYILFVVPLSSARFPVLIEVFSFRGFATVSNMSCHTNCYHRCWNAFPTAQLCSHSLFISVNI